MRPVIAPHVLTRPCIRPSSATASSHDLTMPRRLLSVRYSRTSAASGMWTSSLSVVSSTLGFPVSVNVFHTAPLPSSLLATCCLAPGLNTVTLSLSCLPVFSLHRCSTMGGNTSCNSCSISCILSVWWLNKSHALVKSKSKPLRSCSTVMRATSCSMSMLSCRNPSAASRSLM